MSPLPDAIPAPPTRSAGRGRGPSLVGLLALVLGLELVLNRGLGRMLLQEPLLPLGRWRPLVDGGGLFVFYLASVLGVVLAVLALVRFVVLPPALPGQTTWQSMWRGVTVVATVGFASVGALGVMLRLPPRLELYLLVLLALLSVQVVRSGVGVPRRVAAWLWLLAAAIALHVAWVATRGLEAEPPRVALLIRSAGEALVLTLAALSPGALFPAGARLALPLVAGALATGGAVTLAWADGALAARLSSDLFGLELPGTLPGAVLHALALGAWVATVTALLVRRGPSRLRGWGLLLVGLAGYQLELPYQMAAMMVGLLCVVDSYAREVGRWLSVAAWRSALQRVAALIGAAEVMTVGVVGFEEARVRGRHDGDTVDLAVRRYAGALALVEVRLGQAPWGEAPPLLVVRRGAPRLGAGRGLVVETGDVPFDGALQVRDARTLHGRDPLLADDLRPRMVSLVDGWLGVWPGRGACLRSTGKVTLAALASEPGPRWLADTLELLGQLRRRG